MRSRIECAMPGPLSATETVIAPATSAAVMRIIPWSPGAASHALSSRLYNARSSFRWSNHPERLLGQPTSIVRTL